MEVIFNPMQSSRSNAATRSPEEPARDAGRCRLRILVSTEVVNVLFASFDATQGRWDDEAVLRVRGALDAAGVEDRPVCGDPA
jgi:hypothetical protein